MMELSDIQRQERRRCAVLRDISLAGPAGLVVEADYAARMELPALARDGLIIAAPAARNRYYLTPAGRKALRTAKR